MKVSLRSMSRRATSRSTSGRRGVGTSSRSRS
ncbi:unnamed protein product [Linum tenue]|uniref:Uncharacterized protein n=2 Tax=Linum tenue TaxID=586396 RepID=A0AAV0LW35_9ROSI|nr:unnamed protein product [Linum tenue]